MSESLEFAKTYNYDTLKTGISLPVILQSGETLLEINAKLDTGASHCIFERSHAELLNLNIESGEPTIIGTATGKFHAFELSNNADNFRFELGSDSLFYRRRGNQTKYFRQTRLARPRKTRTR